MNISGINTLDIMAALDTLDEMIVARDKKALRVARAFHKAIGVRVDDEVTKIIIQSWIENIAAQIKSGEYEIEIEDGGYNTTVDVVEGMINTLDILIEAPDEDWYHLFVKMLLGIWHFADIDGEVITQFITKMKSI